MRDVEKNVDVGGSQKQSGHVEYGRTSVNEHSMEDGKTGRKQEPRLEQQTEAGQSQGEPTANDPSRGNKRGQERTRSQNGANDKAWKKPSAAEK